MKTVVLKTTKMKTWECPICHTTRYERWNMVMEHNSKKLKRRVSCDNCGFIFRYVLPTYKDRRLVKH